MPSHETGEMIHVRERALDYKGRGGTAIGVEKNAEEQAFATFT